MLMEYIVVDSNIGSTGEDDSDSEQDSEEAGEESDSSHDD